MKHRMPPFDVMPNDWHPAYDAHWRYLRAWLLDDGKSPVVKVPFTRRPTVATESSPEISDPCFPIHTLTKNRCFGLAPYVGHPFVYTWVVATDELGRAIAGPSEILVELAL